MWASDKLNSYSACAHSAIKKVQELTSEAGVPWSLITLQFEVTLMTCTYSLQLITSSKIAVFPAELQSSVFFVPNKNTIHRK